ncbi:PAS domain S-box protein [Desulforhopalus sp. 52FAK]
MTNQENINLQRKLDQALSKIESLRARLHTHKDVLKKAEETIEQQSLLIEKFEKQRNKYRKLFNSANDSIFVVSLDKNSSDYGRFTEVNNVACKRLGYTREELFAMSPFELSLEKDYITNRSLTLRLARKGSATFETNCVHKNGSVSPIEVNALRLNVNGKDFFMGIARDITKRQKIEQATRDSERLYRLLADNVHDVIWTTDNTFTPQYVSPSFFNLTGVSHDKAIQLIEQKILATSPFNLHSSGSPFPLEGTSIHWESCIKTASNSILWIESIASPLPQQNDTDQFSGVIVVTRDITTRKKIVLELEAAKEDAFTASHAKSSFLANMSHEVRTPMNGVLGMLQLLTLTQLNSEQFKYVEAATSAGKSLLTIINDILDYSKIEAGKLQINPELFQIREMVRTLITSFETSVDPADVTLRYEIDDAIPETLKADQTRIRQILFNLVGNAIKFTEQGEILVLIKKSDQTKPNEKTILLEGTISDTGIGIPIESEEKLFELFTQVHHGNKKKFKGTGLGLSIVRQLVNQMGGTVQLKRNPIKGTTVTFTIRVEAPETQKATSTTKPPAPILTSPNRRLSTLIVEDEQINQQILQAILTKLGHQSTLASDGEQALELLKSNRYDIILMDVQMPVLDGIETTKRIRNSEIFKAVCNIPIIALTAYAMAGDQERCLAAGMDSYLSKPVDIKALDAKLKALTSD